MPQNQTFASDTDQLTLHFREANSGSQAILDEQRPRLIRNARIILWCLLEGQHLTGYIINSGIQNSAMLAPKRMSEYRMRIGNIREFGIQIEEKTLPDGCKEWWIKPELISRFKEICKDTPKQ